MAVPHRTLIDRLDAAAERTGIPAFARGDVRQRHYRWLPIVAIVLGVGSFVAGLVSPERVGPLFFFPGMLGYFIAAWFPIYGPVRAVPRPDEFDRAIRQRAFLAGFAAATGAACLGIMFIAGLSLLDRWPSTRIITHLTALVFLLLLLVSAVPTLHASWTTQPIDDEE